MTKTLLLAATAITIASNAWAVTVTAHPVVTARPVVVARPVVTSRPISVKPPVAHAEAHTSTGTAEPVRRATPIYPFWMFRNQDMECKTADGKPCEKK